MFIPANVVATALAEQLVRNYREMFGDKHPNYASALHATTKLVIERIANSDALYHDSDHTVMVTVVGQEILKGRALVEDINALDWVHFTVATLCHDVGYLRGLCPGDTESTFVISDKGDTVEAPRGASDAFLTPYHIERSKIFVRDRCRHVDFLDAERIARAIELTRFPVPDDNDHAGHQDRGGPRARIRSHRPAGRSVLSEKDQCAVP